ncbi:MAG TPA: AI-2E family transporter [Gemmatimonadales bacterium]|jgi:predicted PurR-regulated permease PerM|nr:AI-2E family transporter [Gemmatimonadales bacterium]
MQTRNPSSFAIRLVAAILAVAALAIGKEFFIPIALAFCFHALLRPVVRGLEGLRIPAWLGATAVVLGALVVIGGGVWALSGPVGTFLERAPASISKAQAKIRAMGRPFQRVSDAASGQGPATAAAPPSQASAPPAAGSAPVPPLLATLLGRGTLFVTGLLEVLILLYLMLAAGGTLFRKLVKVVPGPDDKRTVSDVLHETESIVARYLLVTAVINVAQGIAVALAMWAIGMPDPWMWGLLTFALEFIPYLGGAINVGLLLVTAFTTFTSTGAVILPAALYLVITTLQNNVISPYAYGGHLKLSPLAVMICVMFWWFVWGIPGVFLSIPIAATLKVLGDQVPRLAPLGELLGE